ncbi:MAG: peptidoglycan DD-metalloendopeptidase family protein [Tatlockia sp.]|nr:peptidoglycan DD-metalloendopeptidase family protein [Tatlockia sp.]
MYKICVLILILLGAGCGTSSRLAPVVELHWQPLNAQQRMHTVRRGETLYAIAFRYDIDYRQLAAINHIHSPYGLHVGQILQVKAGRAANIRPKRLIARNQKVYKYSLPKRVPQYYTTPKRINSAPTTRGQWLWPVNGRVAANFVPQQGKKGIDIAGVKGEKIHATANGIVAYAGSGLSGYGNLIIVKHNDQLLTAYGNNSRNLVKEGQKVKAGQTIAEIGVIDRRYWGVHFEIRKDGKPVNPLNYLRKN